MPIVFSPIDMKNPALRALVENWKSEIQQINATEEKTSGRGGRRTSRKRATGAVVPMACGPIQPVAAM
jgi:hypothetical protein